MRNQWITNFPRTGHEKLEKEEFWSSTDYMK